MTEFKLKYKELKIKVDFVIGVDSYANKKEIAYKAKNLKTLLKLNKINEILCPSSFKQRYSLTENPRFTIEGIGIYQLNEGEEEIFCIKN